MAGSNAAFDSDAFRTAIRSAMTMGLPTATEDQATFIWDTIRTFQKADSGGKPLDWSATPETSTTFDEVQVPVAIEYASANGRNTPVGEFQEADATLTMLDEDYLQIIVGGQRANKVRLGGDIYTIEYVQVIALFDVDVYQVYVKAVDEA